MDDQNDEEAVCLETEAQLCRLAVGLEPPDVLAVTHHVRECASCQAFVDEVADVRSWLDTVVRDGVAEAPRDSLDGIAARALGRELAARFARDLLAVVEGKAPRLREERERDRERLVVAWGAEEVAGAPWPEVFALIDRPPHSLRARARALDLASELDPLGLDISLSHIATLVRVGDIERADQEADRWTRLV